MSGVAAGGAADGPGSSGPAHRSFRTVALPVFRDERGALSFAQAPEQLPFRPVRHFILYDLVPGAPRGAHAHRELEQFLFCAHGECDVSVEDSIGQETFRLSDPSTGLYLAPHVWTTVEPLSPGTVVVVLASHPYDAEDYIADYEEFRTLGAR